MYRTRYSSTEKIEALMPNAAIDPPAKVGLRNSDRSNIGDDPRSSATRNATSSTAAAIRQPRTSESVKERWLDSIRP